VAAVEEDKLNHGLAPMKTPSAPFTTFPAKWI
jgi:hypothetical protein